MCMILIAKKTDLGVSKQTHFRVTLECTGLRSQSSQSWSKVNVIMVNSKQRERISVISNASQAFD